MKRKKSSKKARAKKALLVLLSTLVIISSGAVMYSKNFLNTDKIYDNVYINGVEVSALDKDSAKKLISEKFKYGNLTLKNGDKEFKQDLSKLGFTYDIDTAVSNAYSIGRKGSFLQDSLKVLSMKMGAKENIELSSKENIAKLEDFYKNVESQINVEPTNATVAVNGGNVSIIPSRIGHKIDVQSMKKDVEIALKSSKDKNPIVDLKIIDSHPTVKEDQLNSINGIISIYTSEYDTRNEERSYNVALTAQKVDNELVMPGEEVSFLNSLGYVSVENGFKSSKIIVNNKYEDGIGGGVCQVSSTLYNALLMGGVDITQRTNHSFPIGYIPTGRDATVANDGPDLKYQNNYDFPIFIKTYAYDGTMVAVVYGDTTRAQKYEVASEVTSTTEPNVVYQNDSTMPKGKEVVEDWGHTGYTAISYKIANGQKIVVSRDTYVMTPKIIKVGTGAPIESVEENKENAITKSPVNSTTNVTPAIVVTKSQPAKNNAEQSQDSIIF